MPRIVERFQLLTDSHIQHSKAGQEHERKGARGSSPLSTAAGKLGKQGGPARARKLSAQRRSQIAAMGGKAAKHGTARQRKGKSTGGAGDTGGLVSE